MADTLSMITGERVDESNLPTINIKDVAKTMPQFWTPLEVSQRKGLLDSIISRHRGIGTSGFASSGTRTSSQKTARDLYGKEMENVWAEIEKGRLEGVESLSDTISQIFDRTRGTST